MVDYSKLAAKAGARAASLEGKIEDICVEINDWLERRLKADPKDELVKAIVVLVRENPNKETAQAIQSLAKGDIDKALTALGGSASASGSSPLVIGNPSSNGTGPITYAPPARQHNGDWLVPELDKDGNQMNGNTLVHESSAKASRWDAVFDQNDPLRLLGYRNPINRPTPAVPAATSSDDTTMLDVIKGRRRTGDKISVADAAKDKGKYEILVDTSGKPVSAKIRSWV